MALLHRSPTSADSSPHCDHPFSINSGTLDEFEQRPLLENETNFDSPQKNNIYTHEIDFLGADSLYTISRGSLQMVPDPSAIEQSEDKPDNCMPPSLKHSESSLLFMEELESENEEAQAKRLIVETRELSLRESSQQLRQDIFNSPSLKSSSTSRRLGAGRLHHIKEVKTLVRELKRETKYREKIVADVVLKGDTFTKRIKRAVITPIANLSGQFEGLIIHGAVEEMKVRLLQGGRRSDSKMELWDECLESWLELQFKIRLVHA